MKAAVIFIHGRYPAAQLSFYRKLCQGKFKIAANGGYKFFKKARIIPDLLIGDFDSIKLSSLKLNKRTQQLSFPENKDKTDAELAVQYCVDKGFRSIDIVMPSVGEPDHFMGLVSLLSIPELSAKKKYSISARIVNHTYEVMLLNDREIHFTDCKNQRLSVLPFGGAINLTCDGMRYPAADMYIRPWQTTSLRNLITSDDATVSVRGQALLFHYWRKI